MPEDYFAESEISLDPELEIDVAALADTLSGQGRALLKTKRRTWTPSRPKFSMKVDFSHLEGCEVLVYQDLGGAELRGAIGLISPGNKDRTVSRRTFAAKGAGYLRRGIGLIIVDIVTSRSANLHKELVDALDVASTRAAWSAPSGLYAVAYRPVTRRKAPSVEVWPEALALGKSLPVLPLWLALDLCVPVRLDESYLATCQSLRISA